MPPQPQIPQPAPAQQAPAQQPQMPGGQPQVPGQDPGSMPMTPEHRQELLGKIGDIRGMLNQMHTNQFAAQHQSEAARQLLLKQVFQGLQKAGVDLTSRDSVAKFMQGMRENNPHLAVMFENALSSLLGDQDGPQLPNYEDISKPDITALPTNGVPTS